MSEEFAPLPMLVITFQVFRGGAWTSQSAQVLDTETPEDVLNRFREKFGADNVRAVTA